MVFIYSPYGTNRMVQEVGSLMREGWRRRLKVVKSYF